MQINQAGVDLIKAFERLKLTVYADAVGLPTCGYGHMDRNLRIGDRISLETAESLLHADLARFEAGVSDALALQPTDNQFAALVAFAFNVGLHAFQGSTLLKKMNAGDPDGASEEFGRWAKAGGKTLLGLVRRRAAERALFLTA